MNAQPIGYLAEFPSAEELLKATRRTREAGYRNIDTFSPYPVEGIPNSIGFHDHRMGWLSVIGGLVGFFSMLGLQLFVNADYPIEVGGRPLMAFPAFFVVDFEIMILGAVLFPVIGMLALNGLPRLYHPLFNAPRFSLSSDNRFFLYIEATDPKFDLDETRNFLGSLGAWLVEPVRP